MATFTVTKDTAKTVSKTAPRDMDVLFDVTTASFSVYITTTRNGVVVAEQKVRFGTSATIHFLQGDQVDADPTGTGSIDVTIL